MTRCTRTCALVQQAGFAVNYPLVRLGLAGQPPHIYTIYMNQPAILLSHINEPATIRTSQPNRLYERVGLGGKLTGQDDVALDVNQCSGSTTRLFMTTSSRESRDKKHGILLCVHTQRAITFARAARPAVPSGRPECSTAAVTEHEWRNGTSLSGARKG